MVNAIYLKKFQEIINDQKKIKEFNLNSHYMSDSYEAWETSRKFISEEIDHDGTLMDIGCANGWLLLCLMVWSGKNLTPYGIDIDKKHISDSKSLFPEYENNFTLLDLRNFTKISHLSLPKKYDYILWSVWENWDFSKSGIREVEMLKNSKTENGKLLLAFYSEGEKQYEASMQKINFLEKSGFTSQRVVRNTGPFEVMSVIE